MNPCTAEWVSAELSKELATVLHSQCYLDQAETGGAGMQQFLAPAPALADSAVQASAMQEVFSRVSRQMTAMQRVHPKMKEILATGLQPPGSSSKGKPGGPAPCGVGGAAGKYVTEIRAWYVLTVGRGTRAARADRRAKTRGRDGRFAHTTTHEPPLVDCGGEEPPAMHSRCVRRAHVARRDARAAPSLRTERRRERRRETRTTTGDRTREPRRKSQRDEAPARLRR